MKSFSRSRQLLRNLVVPLSAIALGLLLCQSSAHAQSLTIDYSIGDLATGTNTQSITPNTTYTVEIWAVVASPLTTTGADLGFEQAQFGADSSTTSTPAILGGTASTTGGNAGVGVTAINVTSTFLTANAGLIVPSTSGSIGDFTNDGINDISSSTAAATPKGLKATTLGINVETNGFIFGGTTSATSEAFGNGWAFEIGTFSVTTGATIGAAGSKTIFTPVTPTYNNGGKLDYTVTGTTTATPITIGAIAVGQAVSFAVPGSSGGATTTTYNLSASTSAANIHVTGSGTVGSQSATITSTITNVGTGTADTLDYTGLTATSSGTITGSSTSGGPLANAGGAGSNNGLTFSSGTAGAFVITPTVGTATNATLTGSATKGTTTTTTVNVWNLANATINATTNPTVNLGNIHTNGTFSTSALTIANTAPAGVSEGLDASFGTPTSPASTNGGTITTLAAGSSNNTSLVVGLGGAQASAGTISGTVPVTLTSDGTGTSGLGTTLLTTQTVTITGKVWNLASAAPITPTPINLGIVHVGGTFGTQALTIQNTAAANVSEGLDASFGTLTGSASTNGGSITTLAAGAAANTTSMVVGLGGTAHTATAGAVTGTAPVTLTSDGTGTSGLASTPLTSQAITVNGTVNNFAQPVFTLTNAVGTLTGSGTSYTLNLNGASGPADLSVLNNTAFSGFVSGFQDTLGGSYVPTTLPDYTVTGATAFSGIAAGSSQSGLTLALTGTSLGKSESLTFTPTSSNASTSNTPLSNITLTIIDAAAGGNTSVLKLSPTTLTYNVLQNATSSLSQNLSLQETSGTSAATYTGSTIGSFTVTNGASGTVAAGTTNTLPTSYTGSTATDGTFTGSYTASNTSGSTATQGNLVSNFTVNVGNATPDKTASGSFTGTVLSASVAAGGSFAGLASSSNGGVAASNSGLPGIEGSTAQILLGNYTGTVNGFGAGVSATPSMTWRSRMVDETPANDSVAGTGFVNGSPTHPPLPGSVTHPLGLISDVVDLFGMASGSTQASTTTVQTDPFVFQMNFNPKTLNAQGASGNAMASHGNLYLASFVGTTWENTIIPDFTVGGGTGTYFGATIQVGSSAAAAMHAGNSQDALGSFNIPVLESFSAFQTANSITASNVGNFIGDWGVDTSTNEAWAIINHNSDFAVVPEPSTIVLAAFGLFGCMFIVRRRKNVAAV